MESPIISPLLPDPIRFSPALRIAVMASGNGTNFEAIIKSIRSNILDAEISILISNNPQSGAIKKAQKYNIHYELFDHRKFKSRNELDQSLVQIFKSLNIDIIVMAGWMRIITNTLIDAYPGRVINVHPSLLPSFKGIDAICQAMERSVKITGCTVHIVDVNVDSGPILIQSAVPIYNNDDYTSLHKRIQKQEHKILPMGIAIAAQKFKEVADS